MKISGPHVLIFYYLAPILGSTP